MELPWQEDSLKEWSIVGMNHYRMDGERRLFIAMTRNGKCVIAEGPDDASVWWLLRERAEKADKQS